jgi:hypothetical protein
MQNPSRRGPLRVMIKRAPLELPPAVARRFVADMRERLYQHWQGSCDSLSKIRGARTYRDESGSFWNIQ